METIIHVARDDSGKVSCRLVRSPGGQPSRRLGLLGFPPENAVGLLAVPDNRVYGQALFTALSAKADISPALNYVLAASPNDTRPVLFETFSAATENLRWETLHNSNRFLALDRRWPIARRAESHNPNNAPVAEFRPPLKIAAMISASGVDPADEWINLYSAVASARTASFPIEILVFTGHQQLWTDLNAGIGNGTFKGVRAQSIPEDPLLLERELNEFSPHVIHFFCHGLVDTGGAWLNLETLQAGRSLTLPIDTLAGFNAIRSAWLVVLNSCNSGAVMEGSPSMALRLAESGGVPAVVGMMKDIDPRAANAMTAGYYSRLLSQLRVAYAAALPGQEIRINWAEPMCDARSKILVLTGGPPDTDVTWTLPVIYLRTDRFVLNRPYDGTNLSTLIVSLATDVAKRLPPNTPQQIADLLVNGVFRAGQ